MERTEILLRKVRASFEVAGVEDRGPAAHLIRRNDDLNTVACEQPDHRLTDLRVQQVGRASDEVGRAVFAVPRGDHLGYALLERLEREIGDSLIDVHAEQGQSQPRGAVRMADTHRALQYPEKPGARGEHPPGAKRAPEYSTLNQGEPLLQYKVLTRVEDDLVRSDAARALLGARPAVDARADYLSIPAGKPDLAGCQAPRQPHARPGRRTFIAQLPKRRAHGLAVPAFHTAKGQLLQLVEHLLFENTESTGKDGGHRENLHATNLGKYVLPLP